MKITFVLPTLDMSGGNRVVAIYARKLAGRGHSIFLVSPPRSRPSFREGVRRLILGQRNTVPIKSHVTQSNLDVKQLNRWRPVIDADVPDADVVVATWWETAEWVMALNPAKGAKVYFVQGHEVFPWLPVERCKATYRLPLQKIVVSRWLRDVMAREYGEEEVMVVHNSVDHLQFHAVPRGKQARPTIGFLYSKSGFKGIDVIQQLVGKLRVRLPNLRVVSFGTTGLAAIHADQRIEFHHDPPQSELAGLYASCDVWLTASRSEGFNLPAMEAMACRTPVVSTRTGWPDEAITIGVNGDCVPIDDVGALFEATYRVLTLPDAQWRRVSDAAFETVRESSWDGSCDLFERALLATASGRCDLEKGTGQATIRMGEQDPRSLRVRDD